MIDSVTSGTTYTSVGGNSGGRLGVDGALAATSLTIGNLTGSSLPATLYIDNSYYSTNTTLYSLALNGDGNASHDIFTLTNAVTSAVTVRGGLNANTSASNTGNLTFTLGAGAIDVVNSAAVLTFTNPVTTTAGITKTGAGKLVLSSTSNSITGGINAYGGTIEFSSLTALGGATNTVTYNGGTLRDTSTATTGSTSRAVTLTGNGTFEMTNATGTATLSGSITGAGSFTKTGDGTLVLSGGTGNTFSGGLHINGGTIEVSTTSSLGTAASGADVTMEAGATLRDTTSLTASTTRTLLLNGASTVEITNSPGQLTVSGSVTGTGGLTKTGAGTLVLSSDSNSFGGATVNAGTLNISGNTTFGAGLTVNNGAKLVLSGTNTLTGGSTVNGGTLEFSTVNALGLAAGNAMTLNGGLMRYTATGTGSTSRTFALTGAPQIEITSGKLTVSGTVGGSGASLTKIGAGTLIMSGSQTYDAGTTVSAGTLLLNGNYTGGLVSVSSGASLGGTGSATSISNAGTVSAGTTGTVGTFAVSSLSGAGTVGFDIDGASADRINVTGLLDLTGATLSFNALSTPTSGVYVLASYGTLSGSGSVTTGTLPAGYTLDYNYQGLNEIALVPEPAVLGVMGFGVIALGRRRHKR